MTSKQQVREELIWRLCEKDSTYFFENYYYIPVVGVGPQLYHPRDYQRDLHRYISENDMINGLKARQIGYTTASVAHALHDVVFNPEHPWLFVSRTEDAAVKMLQKAMYAYHRLPGWMKERIGEPKSFTQTSLVFENGSRIESIPTTAATGRGDAVFGVVIDEAAFIDNADHVWAALEPLVYGKVLIISTANGMGNFFHEVWLDSQRPDSVWFSVFFPWDVVPSRDENWYNQKKLSYRGREWAFYQEYPSNPEEAFVKSGRVAFTQDVYSYCDFRPGDKVLEYVPGDGLYETEEGDDPEIAVHIWEEPHVELDEEGAVIRPPNYVISCDVAEGLDHGDYTVVKGYNANTFEEVFACRSHIDVSVLGEFLETLGFYYHTALLIIERNNHGIAPLTWLQDAGYPRMYRPRPLARRRRRKRDEYGWHTNKATKPKMVKDFLRALQDEEVMLHDEWFRYEAQVFVADGKGSYSATTNNHDDAMIATLIGYQGMIDVGRFPPIFHDYSVKKLTIGDVLRETYINDTSALDAPLGQRKNQGVKTFMV